MAAPRTIHDFGGFPAELFAVRYAAPGDPALAREVQRLLPVAVELDDQWGLDHGTWSVLRHMYPAADIPVLQLSIDEIQPPEFHYRMGTALRALRDTGVLILGSGDIVHNLHTYAWGRKPAEPFDWAVRFETRVRELLGKGEHAPLIDYASDGPRRPAFDTHAGTLSTAAVRAGCKPARRARHVSRRRDRWRLGFHARRTTGLSVEPLRRTNVLVEIDGIGVLCGARSRRSSRRVG